MKKSLRIIVSLLMVLLILASIVWYLFVYDRAFTRDTLLQQARFHDLHGNSRISAMMYDFAYVFSDQDEDVAIELANQYKADGNYTKAEYTLTAAIKNNPTVDLYVALCRAYVEQDKLLDAVNLLDNIGNPQMKEQLDALRPTAPAPDCEAGFYSEFVDVRLSSNGKYIFYTMDGEYPSTEGDFYKSAITLPSGETLIYAVAVAENGLVSPLTSLGYTITGVIQEVTFADPAVEAAARQLLDMTGEKPVLSNQLWEITEFTMPEGVKTYEDLQWMPYLKTLSICGQNIQTLAPLASLAQLEDLDLSGSRFPVDDMQIIANLPALKVLAMSDCGLSTISDLYAAQNLTHLYLSDNTIRNLDAVSSMTALTELDLTNNAVSDLDALSMLVNLNKLILNYNAVSSLEPLAGCIKLAHLEADHNELSHLDGIAYLPLLTHLSVDSNDLSDVDILREVTGLTNLSIASNDIEDITELDTLINLQIFDFSANQVEELPEWPDGCPLQTIDGSYNALTSIDSLQNMEHLTHVYMDYNLLTSVDALADNFCLVQVNVYGNEISDVSDLRERDIIVNYNPTLDDDED